MLKALLHVPVTYTHLQDEYLVEIAEFFSSRSYCICNSKYINKKIHFRKLSRIYDSLKLIMFASWY